MQKNLNKKYRETKTKAKNKNGVIKMLCYNTKLTYKTMTVHVYANVKLFANVNYKRCYCKAVIGVMALNSSLVYFELC